MAEQLRVYAGGALAQKIAACAVCVLCCVACHRSDEMHGRVGAAMTDIRNLDSALNAYVQQYGINKLDSLLGSGNRVVYCALTLQGDPQFLEESNPKRLQFLDRNISQESAKGELVDPWGVPYELVVRKVGDQSISVGDQQVNRDCAIWSHGPNRNNEFGSGDDVASWKLERDDPDPVKSWLKEQRY